MTVEWCLPPKLRPISGSEACVSDLHRYMAICRGMATDFELLRDFRSLTFELVVLRDVASGLISIVIGRSSRSTTFFRTSCVRSSEISRPVSDA